MATTPTSIILLPAELQEATVSHVFADAFVRDFFLSAPEWHNQDSTPRLDTLVTVARLSGVCTLWRQLVFLILRRALSPIGSITDPAVGPFPLWTIYGDTLRQLQAQLRDLRRHELASYRDLVVMPTPHQQPPPNPVLTVGTPPSPTGIPVPPITQTPPLPLHTTINPSAPPGVVPAPGLPTLAPATAPIAIPAVGGAAAHSTPAPLLPTTTNNERANPLFTVMELHARADVFRRTYRGSGQPHCRMDQSLRISTPQGTGALSYIHRASALVDQLNIDQLGMALDRVLQGTEDDIAFGLRVCEWQETLQRLCTFPPWDQQAACEVKACLLEIERHVNTVSLPLLQLSGLIWMINSTSNASHILPLLVGKELVDCRAKAHNISMEWTKLQMRFQGYF